jgi:hypothetical protein
MPTGFPDSLTPVARFIEWFNQGPCSTWVSEVDGWAFLAKEYGHLPWHPRGRVSK